MPASTPSRSTIRTTTGSPPTAISPLTPASNCSSPEARISTAIHRMGGNPAPCRFPLTRGVVSAMRRRMPDSPPIAIGVRGVEKDYRALRPLRVRALDLHEGESIALLGFDRAAAEVFVNLITAATVPDAGEIHVLGRPTAAIQDADTWLSSLDGFGIVSERAVVLDSMTVEENLTMPLTMALHETDDGVRAKVERLAAEVGLAPADLRRPVAAL